MTLTVPDGWYKMDEHIYRVVNNWIVAHYKMSMAGGIFVFTPRKLITEYAGEVAGDMARHPKWFHEVTEGWSMSKVFPWLEESKYTATVAAIDDGYGYFQYIDIHCVLGYLHGVTSWGTNSLNGKLSPPVKKVIEPIIYDQLFIYNGVNSVPP
jgi:hypothetical protein